MVKNINMMILYIKINRFRIMRSKGFTLIELVIVVAILGVVIGIAIPFYRQYIHSANEKACLAEVQSYSNFVYYLLSTQNNEKITNSPNISACAYITNAISWNESTTSLIIEAKSKNSSEVDIRCDLSKGANCTIIP
ncbi:prepilin-type N-terminal cleavage/methylation domain-containing protein [Acinetobacter sp.]|jgi:type IV pilus assembly protein PilA|uniref:type IV pilin protein n=1 Tax=Acinetobacter sp. TaxID=472 RepID=UPI003341B458